MCPHRWHLALKENSTLFNIEIPELTQEELPGETSTGFLQF